MKENIIFLDIDGVITSVRTGWFNWDIYATHFLRWVCKKSNTKIVISSTWRKNHSHEFFKSILGEYLHEDWSTPILDGFRGKEINAWLNEHDVDRYLILDDDSDFLEEQVKFHIKTDSYNGLLFVDMMKIRDFFHIKEFPREERTIHQHNYMFAEHNMTQNL